jgi:hypothetical protein
MNTECDICYNTTIINPCGANDNCKAKVCNECFYQNYKDMNGFKNKCYFCRNIDYRQAITYELENYFNDDGGTEWDKNYILCMLQVKSYGYEEYEEYKDFPFCIPCDDDEEE